MAQSKPVKDASKEANMDKPASDTSNDSLELDEVEIEYTSEKDEDSPENLQIIEEITELLSNEDISTAVKNFKADSEGKEIALEFANSHILFLKEIVESDNKKAIERTDVEIRDLISHVNIMLKNKDEFLFTTMVIHSPSHYKNMQKKLLKKNEEVEEEKSK